jgi:hypothetical protein
MADRRGGGTAMGKSAGTSVHSPQQRRGKCRLLTICSFEDKRRQLERTEGTDMYFQIFKGIVSRDFAILFLYYWIDMKFLIGPDQIILWRIR